MSCCPVDRNNCVQRGCTPGGALVATILYVIWLIGVIAAFSQITPKMMDYDVKCVLGVTIAIAPLLLYLIAARTCCA